MDWLVPRPRTIHLSEGAHTAIPPPQNSRQYLRESPNKSKRNVRGNGPTVTRNGNHKQSSGSASGSGGSRSASGSGSHSGSGSGSGSDEDAFIEQLVGDEGGRRFIEELSRELEHQQESAEMSRERERRERERAERGGQSGTGSRKQLLQVGAQVGGTGSRSQQGSRRPSAAISVDSAAKV